jgi:hypothetical protein
MRFWRTHEKETWEKPGCRAPGILSRNLRALSLSGRATVAEADMKSGPVRCRVEEAPLLRMTGVTGAKPASEGRRGQRGSRQRPWHNSSRIPPNSGTGWLDAMLLCRYDGISRRREWLPPVSSMDLPDPASRGIHLCVGVCECSRKPEPNADDTSICLPRRVQHMTAWVNWRWIRTVDVPCHQ